MITMTISRWKYLLLWLLFPRSSSGLLQLPSQHRWLRPALFGSTQEVTDNFATVMKSASDFSRFDYTNHWYPVAWAQDLLLDQPTKITIFDVDYVVAKIKDDEVVAMLDRCPHKSAALSEGRVTGAGYFQCAYHGWSFDGRDGSCKEIPQVVKQDGEMGPISSRACGTAIPAQIVQGMVYLFPGGNLEKALLAPSPPKVAELEQEGWKNLPAVRDFPVDWAILLENILDPDHGLFAHQQDGFDLYTATADAPQTIVEEVTNGGQGWTVTASVDADYKLLHLNNKLTGKKSKPQDMTRVGYVTFVAPSFAYYCRRDKTTGETAFMTTFYITPTGTGRSRFMSGAVFKAPFSLPRWAMTINLMNFLDQDTYLLATQQQHVLKCEAEAVHNMNENQDPDTFNSGVRLKNFAYRSPSEKLGVRLGAFWDQTLSRVPNRIQALKAYRPTLLPPRSVVLDREVQHLNICPDSQGVVRKCRKVEDWSRRVLLLTVVAKVWTTIVARGLWASRVDQFLSPTALTCTILVSSLVNQMAKRLRREYFFKYTPEYRDRDLSNISKMWRDRD